MNSQSPTPSLTHSPAVDRSRESTFEGTPPHTPVSSAALPVAAKKAKAPPLWHSKQHFSTNAPSNHRHSNPILGADWTFDHDPSEPLFEDDDSGSNPALPLFAAVEPSPPAFERPFFKMTEAVDISLPPRLSASQSPRNQQSTLTSALQEVGAAGQHAPDTNNMQYMAVPEAGRLSVSGAHDSMSALFGSSAQGTGARPIAMRERSRRESNNAGSFMGGMSWGGISVGSLRDDILMTGTSPMPFGRSPSLHSSSYLPKMEASFLSGYECCGQRLDTLHELLQHFEECHAQQSGQIAQRASISGQGGFSNARRPSSGALGEAPRSSASIDQRNIGQRQNSFVNSRDGFSRTQLSTVQDVDSLEDMEMDETEMPATPVPQVTSPRQTPTIAPLNTSVPPTISAGQPFRTSTPSTPNAAQAFQLYSNPTVSSVNTPALGTQSFQSHQSPHTSVPGTPAEPNLDFSTDYMANLNLGGMNGMNGLNDMNGMGGMNGMGDMNGMGGMNGLNNMGGMNGLNNMGGMPMQGNLMMQNDFNFDTLGLGPANNMNNMTIDEPAKRLFSKAGSMTQEQIAFALKRNQMDVEAQKKLREKQLIAGLGGPVIGLNNFPEQENKPYKCPVIGCEKAYKNQNGLKYHKQHGHNNQKLIKNEDGTFSIVDPVTSVPYPGTQGMEKEKPYQCTFCGKRYKNLNGLKYHKGHSDMCNTDRQMPTGLNPNANVAGNMF